MMDDVRDTYREFNMKANRLAHGLRQMGISPGEMVTVMMPNSPEFMYSWFALMKLGAVEVPINTAFRGSGLAHMINICGASVLILDAQYADQVAGVADSLTKLRTVVLRGDADSVRHNLDRWQVVPYEELFADCVDDPERQIQDDDLAMLLFTSGTTGPSKACMLSHRYVVNQGELLVTHCRLLASDTLYSPFPLFHADATTLTVMPALLMGARVALSERFSASRFWDEVRRYGATVFDFMGATLTMLWKQPPRPDDADNPVRLAWGVPMTDFSAQFERRFNLKLLHLYGLTDAGVVIFYPFDDPLRPEVCGRGVEPYDVRIFDDIDEELPPGQVGEIVVRPMKPSVIMDGYYNMPEETLKAFRNLWFHTGDLAYRDEAGYFYFVGRKKDAIRRRGENISAFEIEEIVDSHPAVLESAAIGVPSELTEEDVKVCVVLRPGELVTPEELIAYCEKRMARHMVPRYVEFVAELPKTPTEKVEKYKLKERAVTPETWDREKQG